MGIEQSAGYFSRPTRVALAGELKLDQISYLHPCENVNDAGTCQCHFHEMRLPTTQACRAARHLLLQRPPVLLPHRCYSSPPNQPTSPQGKPHETLEDHIRSSVPKRLADFLDRLVPSTHSVGLWHSTQRWYPAPSFLGFFPPKGDPGNVAVDGGIQSHVPAGVKLARDWEEWDRPDDPATATATGWKRLWKGGLVTFKHWLPGLTNEGTPWRCHESVHFSDEAALPSPTPTLANGSAAALPKASGTIGVDVLRNYQRPDCTGTSLAIAEVRKLVFVPGHLGPVVSSRERRIIKGMYTILLQETPGFSLLGG